MITLIVIDKVWERWME